MPSLEPMSGTTSVIGSQCTPKRFFMNALMLKRYGRYPMPKP